MVIKYTNIYHSKALQNLPKFGIFGLKTNHLAILVGILRLFDFFTCFLQRRSAMSIKPWKKIIRFQAFFIARKKSVAGKKLSRHFFTTAKKRLKFLAIKSITNFRGGHEARFSPAHQFSGFPDGRERKRGGPEIIGLGSYLGFNLRDQAFLGLKPMIRTLTTGLKFDQNDPNDYICMCIKIKIKNSRHMNGTIFRPIGPDPPQECNAIFVTALRMYIAIDTS
jgi:hypothetical protein